jgi:hypothetical protein
VLKTWYEATGDSMPRTLALALTIDLARSGTMPPADGQRRVCALATSSADTAAIFFWALLASGQINMRKVDGWQSLATKPIDQPIDLAA